MVVLLDKNISISFVTILGQIDPLETGYMPKNRRQWIPRPLASPSSPSPCSSPPSSGSRTAPRMMPPRGRSPGRTFDTSLAIKVVNHHPSVHLPWRNYSYIIIFLLSYIRYLKNHTTHYKLYPSKSSWVESVLRPRVDPADQADAVPRGGRRGARMRRPVAQRQQEDQEDDEQIDEVRLGFLS